MYLGQRAASNVRAGYYLDGQLKDGKQVDQFGQGEFVDVRLG
jgi:hypothetical protein